MENSRGEKFRRLMNDDDVKVVPSDVWFEILRRIPAADLHPLKAVCKTFHRLISSDLFARMHLEDFIKDPKSKRAIIFSKDPMSSHYNSYYYDPDKSTACVWHDGPRFGDCCSHVLPDIHYHHHQVIDSYHGLLLVQICDTLLLCNPITRSYKFLPSFSLLGFASWKIAYDDVSKQYKVFGLKNKSESMSLYVFDVHRDVESHQPRKTTENCQIIKLKTKACVLVNGNVYWLIITEETLNGETRCGICIVSANVTTEKMKTRSCSSITPSRILGNSLFAANKKFYLGRRTYTDYDLELWVLEGVEDENLNPRWVIQHRIDTNRVSSTLSISPDFQPFVLGTFRGKLLINIWTKEFCSFRLCQYDLSSKEFEEVKTVKCGNNTEYGMNYFEYFLEHIDSLISLEPVQKVYV